MKRMQYAAPRSLPEAVRLYATYPDAVLLAGGQVAISQLNRLEITPSFLIDLGRIDELAGISETAGQLRLGACVTHAALATSSLVRAGLPALAEVAATTADLQVRNRATVGGTAAYADSHGDYWPVWWAAGGAVQLVSMTGERAVCFRDWLRGRYQSTLQRGEIIHSIVVNKSCRSRFLKYTIRLGESICAALAERQDGTVALAVGGLAELPFLLELPADAAMLHEQAIRYVTEQLKEISGPMVTPYKKQMARLLARRLLEECGAVGNREAADGNGDR